MSLLYYNIWLIILSLQWYFVEYSGAWQWFYLSRSTDTRLLKPSSWCYHHSLTPFWLNSSNVVSLKSTHVSKHIVSHFEKQLIHEMRFWTIITIFAFCLISRFKGRSNLHPKGTLDFQLNLSLVFNMAFNKFDIRHNNK